MKRIYHPYWFWEDYKNGLYDLEREYSEQEIEQLTKNVKKFLSSNEFYDVGIKVVSEWFFSCEQNLTNQSRNRQAWIGQASCCYKLGVPERITKSGWRLLSVYQQKKANMVADKVIQFWEVYHAKKISREKCLGSF
jgi:hypothetical protein